MHLWRRLGIVQASLAYALALHKRSNYKPLTGAIVFYRPSTGASPCAVLLSPFRATCTF